MTCALEFTFYLTELVRSSFLGIVFVMARKQNAGKNPHGQPQHPNAPIMLSIQSRNELNSLGLNLAKHSLILITWNFLSSNLLSAKRRPHLIESNVDRVMRAEKFRKRLVMAEAKLHVMASNQFCLVLIFSERTFRDNEIIGGFKAATTL